MYFYWLFLGILAVWRVSYLLVFESGPWNLLARLRNHFAQGFWGELTSCLYCVSVWVALPVAALRTSTLPSGTPATSSAPSGENAS